MFVVEQGTGKCTDQEEDLNIISIRHGKIRETKIRS